MASYKKIKFDLSDLDLFSFSTGVCLHHPNEMNLKYYGITDNALHILENRLPEQLRQLPHKFYYCIMTGPGRLVPHIDSHTKICLNYYHKAGDSLTPFYDCKVENPMQAMNKRGKYIKNTFEESQLTLKENFSAEDDECYILDVSIIHNVELFSSIDRHFINIAFTDNNQIFNETIKCFTNDESILP